MKDHAETENNINEQPSENKEHTNNVTNGSAGMPVSENPEVTAAQPVEEPDKETVAADKVHADLKAAEVKLAEMQDRYLRVSAEFDNYRKRTLREKIDLTKYAGENIFRAIIPLMDDFERALLHMETAPECTALKEGIDIIYNKFSEFLKQNGIKEIESLNCDFSVEKHEAVAKVPVEDETRKGKVVDVMLKGYYLQDKVLRFAKVVIGE